MSNAAVNIHVQVFVWTSFCAFLLLLSIYLGVELLGQMINLQLRFLRSCQTVLQSDCIILHLYYM